MAGGAFFIETHGRRRDACRPLLHNPSSRHIRWWHSMVLCGGNQRRQPAWQASWRETYQHAQCSTRGRGGDVPRSCVLAALCQLCTLAFAGDARRRPAASIVCETQFRRSGFREQCLARRDSTRARQWSRSDGGEQDPIMCGCTSLPEPQNGFAQRAGLQPDQAEYTQRTVDLTKACTARDHS